MNKFLLALLCSSLCLTGCGECRWCTEPDWESKQYFMEEVNPQDISKGTMLTTNWPLDSLLESKCMNLGENHKAEVRLSASVLKEYWMEYQDKLEKIEYLKNKELSSLDKSDTKYQNRYDIIMSNYNESIKSANDYYLAWISQMNGFTWSILTRDLNEDQLLLAKIWLFMNKKPRACN